MERTETVCKTGGHVDLHEVVRRQLDRDIGVTGRRALPQIDAHVYRRPTDNAHQFGLGEGRSLEMQSPHRSLAQRQRLTVLHPSMLNACRFERRGHKYGREETACVRELPGPQDLHALYRGPLDLHD